MKATINQYGFTVGDDKGIILRVSRLASSRPGEKRRWAAVAIVCQNGDRIEVCASPKLCEVRRKYRPLTREPGAVGRKHG